MARGSKVNTVRSWLPMLSVLVLVGVIGLMSLSSGCSTVRPPRGVKPSAATVLATGYCRCGKCCGWKRNWRFKPVYASGRLKGKGKRVGETASGAMARKGTIAADTSLYPFGTVMFIEGYGYGRVEDRGGAIKGAHIDLFFNSHQDALEWGRQKLRVEIWRDKG